MTQKISVLRIEERVRIDPACRAALQARYGQAGADSMMAHAVSELALVLAAQVRHYAEGEMAEFGRGLRGLGRMASQVGMPALAQAVERVHICLKRGDSTALAATWARCLRLGEVSLQADWDAHDLSG